jgi:hypothetical protein
MTKFRNFLGVFIVTLLAGCESYHADFACNATTPAQCAPIHEINAQMDSKVEASAPKDFSAEVKPANASTPKARGARESRTNEVFIWLAGYEDKEPGHA